MRRDTAAGDRRTAPLGGVAFGAENEPEACPSPRAGELPLGRAGDSKKKKKKKKKNNERLIKR